MKQANQFRLCEKYPGGDEHLIVVVNDPVAFARWHLGHIEWTTALRSGAVTVTGPPQLRRALPTWNRRPEIGAKLRAAKRATAGPPQSSAPVA